MTDEYDKFPWIAGFPIKSHASDFLWYNLDDIYKLFKARFEKEELKELQKEIKDFIHETTTNKI